MSETTETKDSEIKNINEFLLSPFDCFLINKLLDNRYKLLDINELENKTFIRKKRKKKYKINNNKNFGNIKVLLGEIRKLSGQKLKGIANIINLQKEGIEKKGFFELDISKLDKVSIQKLEEYVENCKRKNKHCINM